MKYLMTVGVPKCIDELYEDIVNKFISHITLHRDRAFKERDLASAQKALKTFLYNCAIASESGTYLTLSIHRVAYSQKLIVNGRQLSQKLSHTYTRAVLDYFEQLNCI